MSLLAKPSWRDDDHRSGRAVDTAGGKNMAQLIQLRWLAVFGQLATILVVERAMGIRLPVAAMLGVAGATLALNLVSLLLLRRGYGISNTALFCALLLDIGSLTAQLYLSGGATNPFVSLYLLQVVLGAILLDSWSTIAIVILTSLCFAGLTIRYRPLDLPARLAGRFGTITLAGAWICFALIATLLLMFVTRISRNLRARDTRLADLRQQAAEEEHIVRMGLLASGAAHELGTPLASLAVILGDWKHMPELAANPELVAEIGEMQAEIQRCKAIVTGVLLAAGEARGEAPSITTLRTFLDGVVADWRAAHATTTLFFTDEFGPDTPIVVDFAVRQVIFNVLDNAAEASPEMVMMRARQEEDALVIDVRDLGTGFAPERLARIGKPYESTKGRMGGGLGLFLVVNVMRTLGGQVAAKNASDGGAIVTLTLPLSAIEIGGKRDGR